MPWWLALTAGTAAMAVSPNAIMGVAGAHTSKVLIVHKMGGEKASAFVLLLKRVLQRALRPGQEGLEGKNKTKQAELEPATAAAGGDSDVQHM